MSRYREDKPVEQEERRRHVELTAEQIDIIKDAVLASVYEDIGRSLVKKILWVVGALLTGLLGWLAAKGYVSIKIN